METKVTIDELEVGDHIYVWRTWKIYAHHGIYVGKALDKETPMVIHFVAEEDSNKHHIFGSTVSSRSGSGGRKSPCAECENYGMSSPYHGVQKCCLNCFLQSTNKQIHRYQYGVSQEQLRLPIFKRGGACCPAREMGSGEQAVERAVYLLHNDGFGKYNLLENNCERFAVYCKTKKIFPGSGQVQGFWAGLLRASTLNMVQVDWHHVSDGDIGWVVEAPDVVEHLRRNQRA